MQKLILASTSPARTRLLTDAGINFETVAPGVDEDLVVNQMQPSTAQEMTELLARYKAQAVADRFQSSLVLGCDSALEFEGEILGKPHEPSVAVNRWLKLSGKSGVLHSGQHLIDTTTGEGLSAVSSTVVHFSTLTEAQIRRYVDTGEPLNVAGAFTIDGLGGAFIERIEGDYHTVVGLSLRSLRELTAQLGHEYQDLWR